MTAPDKHSGLWPELRYDAWKDTYATLHRYLQVIGKVRLALAPMEPHWWQVPLYVTTRGLTTSPIPYRGDSFEITADFSSHELAVQTCWGMQSTFELTAMPVAEFYRELMATL